ncbi:synaptotagmin-like protein 4 [Neosynchiropus ocellatus]
MPEPDDTINLGFLSESERELIMEVLKRDEELRQAEEHRVRKLKTELQEVKRKGAKRGSGKYCEHSCGRCLKPLSRLNTISSQCQICKHVVCRNCRTTYPNGSWLCNVCCKESELKKCTGDWFYNQNVNRYCTLPGHQLVKSSLKGQPPSRKPETVGEMLLKSVEASAPPPSPGPPSHIPPSPVPRARPRKPTNITSKPNSGSIASRGSLESNTSSKKSLSDAENISLSSSNSGRGTSDIGRGATGSIPSSPTGSSVSSLTVPVAAETISLRSSSSEANSVPEEKGMSPEPELEVDRLFKKSMKRVKLPAESISTLDLRDEQNHVDAALGHRSHSVPDLMEQEDEDDEEDEDIDSLVNFHKKKMALSSSSLHSSRSALGSLMSIYSEAGDYDCVDVSGDIVFSMNYDEHSKCLLIFIKECRNLAFGDASRQLSNPYVKCYLLPDKSRHSKKKTSIKRHTVNPVYKETLKYSISRSKLLTRTLSISVWHHGRLSRNAFLGEVELPLDCRDLDSHQEDCMALMNKAPTSVPVSAFIQYKGELVISLKYVSPRTLKSEKTKGKKSNEDGGELHVLIKEARNLMAMKVGGSSDSFVKGYLFPITAKSTKQKTPVVKNCLNPHYDHTFVYKEVDLEQLRFMCLELTVWDKEAMLSNEFLGGVRLSTGSGFVKIGKDDVEMDSVGEEVSLWEKMMQFPNSWAEGTLALRSSMGKYK